MGRQFATFGFRTMFQILMLFLLLLTMSCVDAWIVPFYHLDPAATPAFAWSARPIRSTHSRLHAQRAGSFFNPVPNQNDPKKNNGNDRESSSSSSLGKDLPFPLSFEDDLMNMLRQRKAPSLASQPSTILGKPTAGRGFAMNKGNNNNNHAKTLLGEASSSSSPRRITNDPTKPEYDDQGYTLYANDKTGEKSRVFEALVEYPCEFALKIVGLNEGDFVRDMIHLVAESCQVSQLPSYSTRVSGRWTSVTVQAPVQSAQMLYQLYENVDRDPRVKFKF